MARVGKFVWDDSIVGSIRAPVYGILINFGSNGRGKSFKKVDKKGNRDVGRAPIDTAPIDKSAFYSLESK